jgi:hypothetical protein
MTKACSPGSRRDGPRSARKTPLVLSRCPPGPGGHLDDPIGVVLVSLDFIARYRSRFAPVVIGPSDADSDLFEEGHAPVNPLVERGLVLRVPGAEEL